MNAVGARFVEGQEPWKVWERAMKRQYSLAGAKGLDPSAGNGDAGIIDRDKDVGDDGWDMASFDSGSTIRPGKTHGRPVKRDEALDAQHEAKPAQEGDWVDLGSVRYT